MTAKSRRTKPRQKKTKDPRYVTGRAKDGKFLKGRWKGGPGRPPRAYEKIYAQAMQEAVTPEALIAVIKKITMKALTDADVAAATLILKHLVPPATQRLEVERGPDSEAVLERIEVRHRELDEKLRELDAALQGGSIAVLPRWRDATLLGDGDNGKE